MGEVDTKPIEPVRNALSLFGDKGDQRKYQPTRSKLDSEQELEDLSKDLANYKVQLEAKNAAHKQALFKLEHSQKMTYDLSTLLKKSDIERNKYTNECLEGRARIEELESKMKEMADQQLENAKVQEQLSHVLSELKATQRELLIKETELVGARDSELKALTKAEGMEIACNIEKEKKEEVLQQVNEAIHMSQLAAIEAEEEKLAMLSQKDQKIELATKAITQAQKQLEDLRNQIEMLHGLEDEPMGRSILVDSLQLELRQANEALISSDGSASNAIKNLNQFYTGIELKERKIKDQSIYMEALEKELNQLKQENKNAKDEVNGLNIIIESLTGELQKEKAEINMLNERDIKAQVENALLISQLQEARSIFSDVVAAEERDRSKNHGFKQREHRVADEPGYSENLSEEIEACQIDHSKPEAEETNNENNNDHITIPLREYESLIRDSEKTNEVEASVEEVGSQSELVFLKKELEAATVKIGELRARAEQALSRAELTEKAKAALENQIRRQREHRQRRRAALAALQEESTPKQFTPSSSDGTPKVYQPLDHTKPQGLYGHKAQWASKTYEYRC